MTTGTQQQLQAGQVLGRYRVTEPIGKGGMGEVYLAHDTELERDVALKVLPAEVASDRQRMQRFIQEAKTASALNHPNISCGTQRVYGLVENRSASEPTAKRSAVHRSHAACRPVAIALELSEIESVI
jgi:serine/threonine protein kinase